MNGLVGSMEKYVVSRELAEQLKAAGYPQDSQFTYETFTMVTGRKVTQLTHGLPHVDTSIYTAAPISDELLEQLPRYIKDKYLALIVYGDGWEATYESSNPNELWAVSKHSKKPIDALAKLWLWCKENGYIK